MINNNINIYVHTLRQDNNNVYIKGNNEKSLRSSIKKIREILLRDIIIVINIVMNT